MTDFKPQAELIDMVDELKFEFADIPVRSLVHYIRRAAANLCREADVSRQETIIETVPGVEAYDLEPTGDVEACSILSARDADLDRPVARYPREPGPGHEHPCCWLIPPAEIHIRDLSRRPKRYAIEFSTIPG